MKSRPAGAFRASRVTWLTASHIIFLLNYFNYFNYLIIIVEVLLVQLWWLHLADTYRVPRLPSHAA